MGNTLKIPILMYHSLDTNDSVLSIKPSTFREQMSFLKENTFTVITLYDVLSCVKMKKGFPERSIVLTFDDGFKNVYTEAFPVLQEFGFCATIFLTTNYCGKQNTWEGQPDFLQPEPLLSWNEIREMNRYGMQIGAHTLNHPRLTKIPKSLVKKEIYESKKMIEDQLQEKVDFFAYPYGVYNNAIKEIVGQFFMGGCSTNLAFATVRSDPYELERIDMFYMKSDTLWKQIFFLKQAHYLRLRNLLRNMRKFVTGNGD